MRSSTVAKGLLMLGVLVGGAAGVALALGFRVDQLPPWMITVGMYKLAFIAAGGLLAAGAVLGRRAGAVVEPTRRATIGRSTKKTDCLFRQPVCVTRCEL